MTNEELAARVKAGEPGAMLELWEAVRRFVEMKARQRSRHPACDTPYDDLVQAGFLAVAEAAQKYDPGKMDSFLSYLEYGPLRSFFAKEQGFRTRKRDALQFSSSTDEPIYQDEGDETKVTRIEDEGAALAFDGVEYADFVRYARTVINAALDTLDGTQAAILTAYYLNGCSMNEAAEIAGLPYNSAAHAKRTGLNRLSVCKYAKALLDCLDTFKDFEEYHYAAQAGGSTRYQRSGISSTEAAALVR